MARAKEMYGESGSQIRTIAATVSNAVYLSEEGFATGLISVSNDLDQNVTCTVQGRHKGDDSWQTIGTVAVAAGAVGNYLVVTPWGEVRLSSVAAGVPTSGALMARMVRVEGAYGASGATTSATITDLIGATALGQALMAASLPVVVASNQSALPVTDNAGSLTVDDGGTTLSVDDGGGVLSVDDNAGSLTVDQATHNNLNVNANIQVADVDVGAANPVPVSDDWRVSLQADETADDSDKTFTVPASTEWQILWIWVEYTSTAAAGDRQLEIQVQDAAADVIANLARAGVVQAASLTRYYQFGPGLADLGAFRDTDYLTTPIPPTTILQAGDILRIYDNNAVAAAADDMICQVKIASRTV